MGGEPLVAVNLLGWPPDKLPAGLAAEVLSGSLDVGRAAHCHVAGGSIDDPEPKYRMAVTGTADPAALLRIDAGQPGPAAQLDQADRHGRAQCLAQGNGPGQRGRDRGDDDAERRRLLPGACRRDPAARPT
jgi:hypothetical protein